MLLSVKSGSIVQFSRLEKNIDFVKCFHKNSVIIAFMYNIRDNNKIKVERITNKCIIMV